jgi:hypothetical protein
MIDDVYLDGAKVGKWLSQRQRLSRAQNAALPVTMRMETYSFAIHDVHMSLTSAKAFYQWLGTQIGEAEKASAAPRTENGDN